MSDNPANKAEQALIANRNAAVDRMNVAKLPSLEQIASEQVAASERQSMLNQVNFLNFADNSRPIDLSKVYCSKTGKPLGSLNDDIYKRYIQMQGLALAEKNLAYLQNSVCTMSDPCWLHTDGEGLKFLAQNDPIGYYVYATAKAVQYHRLGFNKEKMIWQDFTLQNKFMVEKVHLWEDLQNVALSDIIAANAIWQQFHALMHSKYAKFEYISLEYYGRAGIVADMHNKLSTIIKNAIKAKNQLELLEKRRRFDLASLVANGMGGASNYRMQGKLHNITTIDQLVGILDAIGFDEPADDSLSFLDFPEVAASYVHGEYQEEKPKGKRYSGTIYTHAKSTPKHLLDVKTGQITTTKVVEAPRANFLDKLPQTSNADKPVMSFADMFKNKAK